MTTSRPLVGRTVLVAGATSAGGEAAARALHDAGADVVVVGRDPRKVSALIDAVPGVRGEVCDLTNEQAVADLAERVHARARLDGLLHLVGGWRGGGGLAGQTEEDYRVLEGSLTALRHVSRAFFSDLSTSSAGRLAIVSSTAVLRPLAGGANYAAVKAASEAWVRAVAHGFAKRARDEGRELTSAAFGYRVTSLAGLEPALAEAFVGSWAEDAVALDDTMTTLVQEGPS